MLAYVGICSTWFQHRIIFDVSIAESREKKKTSEWRTESSKKNVLRENDNNTLKQY